MAYVFPGIINVAYYKCVVGEALLEGDKFLMVLTVLKAITYW